MKLQDLLQALQEKPEYKNFKTQNPDTFFAAAFLILNLIPNTERQKNKTEHIQLDFYLPKENKIAEFKIPSAKPKIHNNIIPASSTGQTASTMPTPMQPQTAKIKLDIDDLEVKSKELIKENKAFLIPTKIIAILKDDIWNLTLMDDMLGIARIKINAISGELQGFNKGSLMDFMSIKKF